MSRQHMIKRVRDVAAVRDRYKGHRFHGIAESLSCADSRGGGERGNRRADLSHGKHGRQGRHTVTHTIVRRRLFQVVTCLWIG